MIAYINLLWFFSASTKTHHLIVDIASKMPSVDTTCFKIPSPSTNFFYYHQYQQHAHYSCF